MGTNLSRIRLQIVARAFLNRTRARQPSCTLMFDLTAQLPRIVAWGPPRVGDVGHSSRGPSDPVIAAENRHFVQNTRIYSIVGQKTAPALINIRTVVTCVSSGEQGEGDRVPGPFFTLLPLWFKADVRRGFTSNNHHTLMPFALSSSSI